MASATPPAPPNNSWRLQASRSSPTPLQAFQRHPEIDRIYVVCNPEWNEFVRTTARNGRISKLHTLFPAGDTSIASLRNGIAGLHAELGEQNPAVLTHEAVRPLVTDEIISLNLNTFRTHGNAVTAVRSQEAYMVSPTGFLRESASTRTAVSRTDPDNLQSGRPDRSVP